MTEKEIENKQDEICELCKHHFYDDDVNTNQYNLCEGYRCEDATEYFIESEKDERIYELEMIIRDTIKFNQKNKQLK